jgi:hypothetical protein
MSFREVTGRLLADPRKPQGKRHPLASLVSLLVAGVAAGCAGPLAVAQAAAGWDQETLEAHGCWRSPRTGLPAAPSASMFGRLPRLLDPDELEAALSSAVTALALDPAIPAAYAAHRAEQQLEQEERRKKRNSGDQDHMPVGRRLLHVVADRIRWQHALDQARRRAQGLPPGGISATGDAA